MKIVAIALLLFIVETRALDLSGAILVAPDSNSRSKREKNAVRMLVEEVEKRSRINLAKNSTTPTSPKIILKPNDSGLSAPESFKISVKPDSVTISGKDERG